MFPHQLDTHAAGLKLERTLALARADRVAPLREAARRAADDRLPPPVLSGRARGRRAVIGYVAAWVALAILAAFLIAEILVLPAGAHDTATPPSGSGVTTEVLGKTEPAQAAGQSLFLLRVIFAPGGAVAAHTHPGATIYSLVSGTLRFTLVDGSAQLVRGANGSPAAADAVAEPVPVGETITLTTGDTITYDGSAVQVERNDGGVPAIVLVSNLRGSEEPARAFVTATPTGS